MKVTRVLAAATALLIATSGCSGAKQSEARSQGGAPTCPIAVDESVTGEVRIAYQHIPNGDMIVKDKKWLEGCLPKMKITWIKAESGGTVIKNFGAKSIDLGLIGSSPATKALSPDLNKDIKIKVVWIHDVIGAAESLVVRDTAIADIKGLAGKRIAVPFASTAHYSLLAALNRAGMATGPQAPQLINLEPDAMLAAWQRSDIDAAWVWDPVLSKLTADGQGKMILSAEQTAKEGAPTYDLGAATVEFAEANPQFMKAWTALEDKAVELIQADPAQASESIAIQLGVPVDVVRKQINDYGYLRAHEQATQEYLGANLGNDLFKTAQFLKGQGEIADVAPQADYSAALYGQAAKEMQ